MEWSRSLDQAGWSASSIRRATNRVREFARATQRGLLYATRADVVALATRKGEARGLDAEALVRSDTWRQSVRTVRSFYRWANKKRFLGLAPDPTIGLNQVPPHPPSVRIRPRDGALYGLVIDAPRLGPRDRLVLILLAHGLIPQEVARLRIEDVNLPFEHLTVRGKRQSRVMPLSGRAIMRLTVWLRARKATSGFLFPGRSSLLSASAVRAIVRRAAQLAFPSPGQQHLRRRIYALGFRHLFLLRVIRSRVPLECVRELTGVDRLSRLAPYSRPTRRTRTPQGEIARISGTWRRWI